MQLCSANRTDERTDERTNEGGGGDGDAMNERQHEIITQTSKPKRAASHTSQPTECRQQRRQWHHQHQSEQAGAGGRGDREGGRDWEMATPTGMGAGRGRVVTLRLHLCCYRRRNNMAQNRGKLEKVP